MFYLKRQKYLIKSKLVKARQKSFLHNKKFKDLDIIIKQLKTILF